MPGAIEFRGRFPGTARGSSLRFDFSVASTFEGAPTDRRELGIIIPLLDHPSRGDNAVSDLVARDASDDARRQGVRR
jgi:hypothetical protein